MSAAAAVALAAVPVSAAVPCVCAPVATAVSAATRPPAIAVAAACPCAGFGECTALARQVRTRPVGR